MAKIAKEAILDKLKAEVAAEKDRVAKKIYADFAALGEREKKIVESIMKEDPELTPKMPPPQSTAFSAFGGGANTFGGATFSAGFRATAAAPAGFGATAAAPTFSFGGSGGAKREFKVLSQHAQPVSQFDRPTIENIRKKETEALSRLEQQVTEAFNDGWQPQGGIALAEAVNGRGGQFYQAMVKTNAR